MNETSDGEFTAAFDLIPGSVMDYPTRPLISVLAVAGFVGLILLGSRTTGAAENVLVALKVGILLVFGLMSYLAFRQRDHDEVNAVIPAIGTVGALAFFPLMMYNLYTREPNTFDIVLGIAVLVLAVELLYFEHDVIEEEVTEFEPNPGVIDESN